MARPPVDSPDTDDGKKLLTTTPEASLQNVKTEPTVSEPPLLAEAVVPKHRFLRKKQLVRIILIILVCIGLVVGALVIANRRAGSPPPTNTATTNNNSVDLITTPSDVDNFFQTAKPLNTDLSFFKDATSYFGDNCTGADNTDCTPNVTATDIHYYQIGTTAKQQPIIAAADYAYGEGSFAYVAIETSTNNYAIIGTLDDTLNPLVSANKPSIDTLRAGLSSNVTLDTTTTMPDLAFPTNATVKSLPLVAQAASFASPDSYGYFLPTFGFIRGGENGGDGTNIPDVTKLDQQGNKTFYELTAEDSTNYQVKEIYAVVNKIYAASYEVVDHLTDKAADITWSDGTQNQNTYTSATSGCGSATGYVIGKDIQTSDLTVAGSGPQNQVLYNLSTSSALFQDIYNNGYSDGTSLSDNSLQNLTPTEFQNVHAFFLAKNALGEYVVYERTDMFVGGGCGKPVLYLYPSTPTKVTVVVGAKVSKSDPLYPATGWRNVLAQPNGALTYIGKSYSSLYWEGQGYGDYPLINGGTVVTRADTVATIQAQLSAQGLNSHEINDFLAFWQPKLPTTPYVRLTWLNTAQMNELAPLTITPKPDTLIRVFLDFQGLNHPVSIPTQTFQPVARQGFTAVEWGGLLR